MIVIQCEHDNRRISGGFVDSRGMSFLFQAVACDACIQEQLPYLFEIEVSIFKVKDKDVSFLNRCFDAPNGEEMYRISETYWSDEIDCEPFEYRCDCGECD